MLVTSREALGVFGECVWLAPAMLVPEEGALLTVNDLERFDAIRLFLERAAATGQGFKLDEVNAKTVISICRKLDGIPLAIEMAAARAAALPLQEIAKRTPGADSACLLPATGWPSHASKRCAPRWIGAITCFPPVRRDCYVNYLSLPGDLLSRRRRVCASPTEVSRRR